MSAGSLPLPKQSTAPCTLLLWNLNAAAIFAESQVTWWRRVSRGSWWCLQASCHSELRPRDSDTGCVSQQHLQLKTASCPAERCYQLLNFRVSWSHSFKAASHQQPLTSCLCSSARLVPRHAPQTDRAIRTEQVKPSRKMWHEAFQSCYELGQGGRILLLFPGS